MFKSVKNFAHDSGLTEVCADRLADRSLHYHRPAMVGTKTSTVYTELGNTMN